MTGIEKAVIKSTIKTLKNSTGVGWSSGDLAQWSEWAKRMKQAIRGSIDLLEEIVKEENVADKNNPLKLE